MAKAEVDIFFIKPGCGKITDDSTRPRSFSYRGSKTCCFCTPLPGCDTTSSAFRKSKIALAKLQLKSREVQKAAAVFSDPSSTINQVEEAGKTCVLRWYGAPAKETSLNTYRYKTFLKSVATIKPDISCLPPSEGAAEQHYLRTFHQVQLWLGKRLNPETYGWETDRNYLVPRNILEGSSML